MTKKPQMFHIFMPQLPPQTDFEGWFIHFSAVWNDSTVDTKYTYIQ